MKLFYHSFFLLLSLNILAQFGIDQDKRKLYTVFKKDKRTKAEFRVTSENIEYLHLYFANVSQDLFFDQNDKCNYICLWTYDTDKYYEIIDELHIQDKMKLFEIYYNKKPISVYLSKSMQSRGLQYRIYIKKL